MLSELLASPARFERAAFRLGGRQDVFYRVICDTL